LTGDEAKGFIEANLEPAGKSKLKKSCTAKNAAYTNESNVTENILFAFECMNVLNKGVQCHCQLFIETLL
jgi:hypothetical protein